MSAPIVIEGRLEYLGWERPWSVIGERDTVDLSAAFWQVAAKLKGRPTSMPVEPDNFGLRFDAASPCDCDFDEVGSGIIIASKTDFKFANVFSYCSSILCSLNGRQVIASVEEESFTVFANPMHDVPALLRKLDDRGNMIGLDDKTAKARCKPCTVDACIFLTVGAGGFECAKFADGLTRTIIDMRARGAMRATRIGDCRCAGWEGNR